MSVTVQLQLEEITCCRQGCGIVFAVPELWRRKRREDHTQWYCPNGHPQFFPAKTEAEILREQLAAAKHQKERMEAELHGAKVALGRAKAENKRTRSRVGHGTCPCCKRTFKQLAQHMRTKHPEYMEANAAQKGELS